MYAGPQLAPLLRHALVQRQLPQGGWPFTQASGQPALEPTCLALLALRSDTCPAPDLAVRFLVDTQNLNGSWPAFSGDDQEGCGLTGLAIFALHRSSVQGRATERAVHWLLRLRGWESHWLWQWKFQTTDRHVRFDPDKFGWPWMPETVSWVVPTAYSLLALKLRLLASSTELVRFRVRRGVEMLFDRICPPGGWNAGNGVVYGQPLAPHPDATAMVLLALQDEPANDKVTASLDWLEQRVQTCFAPWSLAWTILALEAYRRPIEALISRLASVSDPAQIRDCTTVAVVSLALDCALERNVFEVTS